jgi:hypothetical protein
MLAFLSGTDNLNSPKTLPWFVSDVLPYDFQWAIDSLLDASFFEPRATLSADDKASLAALANRWNEHLAAGRFRLSIPIDTPLGADAPGANFWCTQFAYQDLPAQDPALLAELQKSDLVIFKGDLKYVAKGGEVLTAATASSLATASGRPRRRSTRLWVGAR